MVEATERLEQRILLALLKQPRPLDWFGNALQGKARDKLIRRGWVHVTSGRGPNGTPDDRLLVLTAAGHACALQIRDERRARWQARRKTQS